MPRQFGYISFMSQNASMANKPTLTFMEILTGVLQHVNGAVKNRMTSADYLKYSNDETSRKMNDLLPPELRRSKAQMDHVLACPVKERHICGPACGYPAE